MAEASVLREGTKNKLDVYDVEFGTNLELAKNLVAQLQNSRDREICKKWISKCCSMKTTDVVVKRNRNSFFKYFLQILNRGLEGDEHYGYPQVDKSDLGGREFMCRWSADKRTYVAAKALPGQGTLVYMAVAKEPALGWEKNGEAFTA